MMRFSRTVRLYLPVCIGLALLIVSLCLTACFRAVRAGSAAVTPTCPSVILDPGHGGVDGGATGISGTVEKEINLQISLILRDLLWISGCTVYMTRETDGDLADSGIDSIGGKKRSDMHHRLALMQAHPEAIVLCIHQNLYTEEQYHGAQMFYSPNNPESERLAACLQTAFVSLLQPDNTRQIKPAGKSIYLLYHSKTPTVLAECGFLSNREEEALLKTEAYQKKVAMALYRGILTFWEETE